MGNMLEISKIEKADLMVIDYARFQTISCFPTDYIPFVNIACNIGTAVAVQCYWVDFFSAWNDSVSHWGFFLKYQDWVEHAQPMF